MNEAKIQVDCATRRNPGPAAIAAIIKDAKNNIIATASQRIGQSTNNYAEYRAVILGLEKSIALGARFVELQTDSQLIVNHISGYYYIRTKSLVPLYEKVKQLENAFEVMVINHVEREYNYDAHNLAHRTLDLVRHIGYDPNCQLIIKLKQTDNEKGDILFIHRLIDILNDFPGQDEVKLSISSKEKIIGLKLSNLCVNYCSELREELKKILGKTQIIVKRLK